MIKSTNNYSLIKKGVEKLFNANVQVIENLGRNKYVSYRGVITGVYPSLFTVSPDVPRYSGKTSFSYSEIMCGNVKLKRIP